MQKSDTSSIVESEFSVSIDKVKNSNRLGINKSKSSSRSSYGNEIRMSKVKFKGKYLDIDKDLLFNELKCEDFNVLQSENMLD